MRERQSATARRGATVPLPYRPQALAQTRTAPASQLRAVTSRLAAERRRRRRSHPLLLPLPLAHPHAHARARMLTISSRRGRERARGGASDGPCTKAKGCLYAGWIEGGREGGREGREGGREKGGGGGSGARLPPQCARGAHPRPKPTMTHLWPPPDRAMDRTMPSTERCPLPPTGDNFERDA